MIAQTRILDRMKSADKVDRLALEKKLWTEGFERIMGLDEVGRGCLAGPVVAAGVILPKDHGIEGIRDSKVIPESERISLSNQIKEKSVYWTIQISSPAEIDDLNILWASIKAMVKCSEMEEAQPDYLLVDGNRYTTSLVPYTCVVKGDDKSESIGAASILAKVYRDELMNKLHDEYPYFGWNTNVGYPTKTHFDGLETHGITKYHRRSFKLRTEKEFNGK